MAEPRARRERESILIAPRRPAIPDAPAGVEEPICGRIANRSGLAEDATAARLSPAADAGGIARGQRGAAAERRLGIASAGGAAFHSRLVAERDPLGDRLAC